MMGIWQRIARTRTPEASQQTSEPGEAFRREFDTVLASPEDYVVISRERLAIMEELIRRYRQREEEEAAVPDGV